MRGGPGGGGGAGAMGVAAGPVGHHGTFGAGAKGAGVVEVPVCEAARPAIIVRRPAARRRGARAGRPRAGGARRAWRCAAMAGGGCARWRGVGAEQRRFEAARGAKGSKEEETGRAQGCPHRALLGCAALTAAAGAAKGRAAAGLLWPPWKEQERVSRAVSVPERVK